MQVILNQTIKTLGRRGEVVSVKPGYFRNFLMPRGMAVLANETLIRVAEDRKAQLVKKHDAVLENAKDLMAKLKGLKLTLSAKVAANGKLYGSVTESDVARLIAEKTGVQIAPTFIHLDHIKEIGKHDINITFGEGLSVNVSLTVKKSTSKKA